MNKEKKEKLKNHVFDFSKLDNPGYWGINDIFDIVVALIDAFSVHCETVSECFTAKDTEVLFFLNRLSEECFKQLLEVASNE